MQTNNAHLWAQEEELHLGDVLILLRQKFWLLLLALVLGGLLSGGFTYFFIAPEYEATASLYIVSASSDSVVNLSDLQIGASLTADYEALVLSRPMLESVIENLNLEDVDQEDLKKMISVTNPADTRILNITAQSKDPRQAMEIANEMARLSVTWLPEIMESNTPNIAEEAVTPEKKSSPSIGKNALLGALAAVFLCCGVIAARHLMNDTIRCAEEMEKYFGIVPLAVVPEEEKANPDSGHNRRGRRLEFQEQWSKGGGRR